MYPQYNNNMIINFFLISPVIHYLPFFLSLPKAFEMEKPRRKEIVCLSVENSLLLPMDRHQIVTWRRINIYCAQIPRCRDVCYCKDPSVVDTFSMAF
jgi:hypothetical protein